MDNPEILFYILFGLIYFLTRGKRKKKQIPSKPRNVTPPSKNKDEEIPPLSFDELLKELTGQSSRAKEEEKRQAALEEEYVVTDEEVQPVTHEKEVDWTKDQMQDTLTSSFDDEAIRKKYEEATADQLIEPIGDIHVGPEKERFEVYKIEKKNSMASEIKEMLEDPDDVKKAVILSEVLNRKY